MTYALLLLELFWEFLKIGVFAVGGGMATLPFLYDLGEKTAWYTSAQVPRYAGRQREHARPHRHQHGDLRRLHRRRASPARSSPRLGTILPGIILVIVLARFLARFHDNRYVNAAFYGLRPASTALIAAAGIGVLGESLFNPGLYREDRQYRGLLLRRAHHPRRRALRAHERQPDEKAPPGHIHRRQRRNRHSSSGSAGHNKAPDTGKPPRRGRFSFGVCGLPGSCVRRRARPCLSTRRGCTRHRASGTSE